MREELLLRLAEMLLCVLKQLVSWRLSVFNILLLLAPRRSAVARALVISSLRVFGYWWRLVFVFCSRGVFSRVKM